MSVENRKIEAATVRLRSSDRIWVQLDATFEHAGVEHAVRVEEISRQGCSGVIASDLASGTAGTIMLPGEFSLHAEVKWVTQTNGGFVFARALSWPKLIEIIRGGSLLHCDPPTA